jgi:hypothetical protein
MKATKFRLIIALLTFGIGVLSVSLWIVKSINPQDSLVKLEEIDSVSVIESNNRSENSIEQIEQNDESLEKIRAIETIKGKLIKFEIDDYIHAIIKKSNGKKESFFICNEDVLDYFLALHKGKQLTLTYQVSDTYLPDSSTKITSKCLTSAKVGNQTFESWSEEMSKKYTFGDLYTKYEHLVDSSVR